MRQELTTGSLEAYLFIRSGESAEIVSSSRKGAKNPSESLLNKRILFITANNASLVTASLLLL